MKALYFTDPHLSDGKPGNLVRIKSFREAVMEKLEWIVERAREEKVDCVLCGGDWFHQPHPSYGLFLDLRDLIRSSGLRWIGVAGNHDLPYNRFQHLRESALGLLREDVELIGQGTVSVEGTEIFCSSYGFEWEVENLSGEVNVVHDMVTPIPFFGKHLDLSSKIHYNVGRRVVLCSHYHKPFEKWLGQLGFINPGALGRLTVEEVDHKPQVVWVDTGKWSFVLEEVPVEPVSIGFEPFERLKLDTRVFVGIQFGSLRVDDFLKGLEPEVAERAKEYLERAKETKDEG